MTPQQLHRRRFLHQTSVGAAAVAFGASAQAQQDASKAPLAVLGGKPVRTQPFPSWPIIHENDREAWAKVLEQGRWCRLDGQHVNAFEKAYAARLGTRHCVATANGTSALFSCMNALGIGPGDEVLVPPYTFVATINVVMLQHALPVFIDTDRHTFQMDAGKIAAAITPRTRCIMPAHIGGNACDMDAILAIAKKHDLPVIEDTCQSHLAEWRGRPLGSLGTAGCFSFQASKNLNSGEGGAVITNDDDFADRCYAFHNNGRGRRKAGFAYAQGGANLRLTEFQAALLMAQLARLEGQARTRDENAAYLTKLLQEIPGITPARGYAGCTRNAYHLYMFRYDRQQFASAPRSTFLKALRGEGVPCSGGYTPLNREPFIKELLHSRAYKAVFGPNRLKEWEEKNRCPENDRLCAEAVWFTQTMLLGPRSDMDQIADAVRKVQAHAADLAKVS